MSTHGRLTSGTIFAIAVLLSTAPAAWAGIEGSGIRASLGIEGSGISRAINKGIEGSGLRSSIIGIEGSGISRAISKGIEGSGLRPSIGIEGSGIRNIPAFTRFSARPMSRHR